MDKIELIRDGVHVWVTADNKEKFLGMGYMPVSGNSSQTVKVEDKKPVEKPKTPLKRAIGKKK